VISIIIATYGGPEWEELAHTRALPSVHDFDAEIIVGHDPEGTIASVRNQLASEAKGEWLVFLDADDELAPGYIEAMEQKMQAQRLLTPIVMMYIKGRPRRKFFYPQVDLKSGNWLILGTALERSLFQKVGGFEDYPHGFEDWSLWAKCMKVGAMVVKVPRAVYCQHINPNSKHRQGWKDKNWQVETHERVMRDLEAWTP
jgi:glycosyltransferase involved in cell wall biosynthesis